MSGELFKAALTAVVGVLVFVFGQIAQRLLLEPIQEQRRVIGEIAFALLLYGNVSHVAQRNPDGYTVAELEPTETVIKTIRALGAKLQQSLRVIPMYSVFAALRIVPSRPDALRAVKALTGWSNSIYRGDPSPHQQVIIRALRIVSNDGAPPSLPRDGMVRSVRE